MYCCSQLETQETLIRLCATHTYQYCIEMDSGQQAWDCRAMTLSMSPMVSSIELFIRGDACPLTCLDGGDGVNGTSLWNGKISDDRDWPLGN